MSQYVLVTAVNQRRQGSSKFENLFWPRLLASSGRLVLHAANIHGFGKMVALVGQSGIGKSTLAATLRSFGWCLSGDDTLAVKFSGSFPEAQALFPRIRLKPDSATRVGHGLEGLGVDSFGKHVFHLPEISDPKPLEAIFVLAVAHENAVSTERLGPSDACFAIVANSFAHDPNDLEEASKRFGLAADLASRVPVFRLSYPRDFSMIPRVAAAITEALEGVSPIEKVRN